MIVMGFQVGEGRVFGAMAGDNPPQAVLIHGAGGDHSVWDCVRESLGSALALDLPGHGGSDGPALDSIAALADWLVLALDAAKVERTVVVGHSMGALVALEFAARHPERVQGLALLGAAAAMPVHPDLLRAALHDLPAASAMIANWCFPKEGAAPHLVERTRRLLEASASGVLHADLTACHGYRTGVAAAALVRSPTLVIIGSQDRMSRPESGAALADAIPGAATVMLEGAGHMMMADQPKAVVEALLGMGLFAR
jgi:pimeloyl-ACP methyl ester carboxylesterase